MDYNEPEYIVKCKITIPDFEKTMPKETAALKKKLEKKCMRS